MFHLQGQFFLGSCHLQLERDTREMAITGINMSFLQFTNQLARHTPGWSFVELQDIMDNTVC